MPSLTKEQQDVVRGIVKDVKSGEQTTTFGGWAGTGKTTCLGVISEIFPNFAVCAYTGKAANVLRRKGMDAASTIHSLIYKPVVNDRGVVEFVLKDKMEADWEGFLADESSMVSREIYEDLLSFDMPIVFVGDHGQLEPVGSPFNVMASPKHKLETIHRNAGEIAFFAEHLRKGKPARTFPAGSAVVFVDNSEVTDEMLLGEGQMICAYNKTRVEKNNRVRELDGRTRLVEKGERVMCLRNNRRRGLFNGMQGIITSVHEKHNKFDFRSDGTTFTDIRFDPKQFGQEKNQFEFGKDSPEPFDYAYCVTAHKCVTPDTIVETPEGLLTISDIAASGTIATPDGEKKYRNKVVNPPSAVLRLLTKRGYEVTVTKDHKVEVWDGREFSMVEAEKVVAGQFVRLLPKQTIMATPKMPAWPGKRDVLALAEWSGMMLASGTIFDGGFRLSKRRGDVLDRFDDLCESVVGVRPKRINGVAEVSSVFLAGWASSLGLHDVPQFIVHSGPEVQLAFLRGLFEDARVATLKHSGYFQFLSTDKKVLDKVRLLLLWVGIFSDSNKNGIYLRCENAITNDVSLYRNNECSSVIPVNEEETQQLKKYLSPTDWFNVRHRGHISKLKAANCHLEWLRDRGRWHFEKVASVTEGTSATMCVEVPDGHKFLQNGFPFGNSQGDEWETVLVFEQICDRWDHKRWSYTSASRAKKSLIWVCPKRSIPAWLS